MYATTQKPNQSWRVISSLRNYLKGHVYGAISVLFCIPCILIGDEYILFEDSTAFYKVYSPSTQNINLKRIVNAYRPQPVNVSLFNILDSLGFFNLHIDTILADTITLILGERSIIDTFLVTGDTPPPLESIQPISFPVLFNSRLIQDFSYTILRYFTHYGYPYSEVQVEIHESKQNKVDENEKPMGPPLFTKHPKNLTVTFRIKKNEQCVFDEPLLLGTFKTSPKIIIQDIVFQHGQLYDERKISLSKERLISRNYITDVFTTTPVIQDQSLVLKGEPDTSSKGVIPVTKVTAPITIEDNTGMGIDGAVAYHSQSEIDWSGLLTVSILNVLNRGEEASLFYRGEKNLQQFEFSIAVPYPFLWSIFTSLSFGMEIESKKYGYFKGEWTVLTQLKGMWQAGGALVGHETTTSLNESSWNFIGFDLIMKRQGVPFQAQTVSHGLLLRSGTGIARRKNGRFYRWHFDFKLSSHLPIHKRQAFLGNLVSKVITTDKKDSLHAVEQIRIGGHNSIRGYAENQFSFNLIVFSQIEYLLYYIPKGSLYTFLDGGLGFIHDISLRPKNQTLLCGYGIGIRIPIQFGRLSIEWARNYKEKKGLGRIHVRIKNAISSRILL